MSSLNLHKKSQVKNWFTVITVLFTFSFISIMGFVLYNSFITEWVSMPMYNEDMAQAVKGFTIGMRAFDYLTLLLFAGMTIALLWSSYKVATPSLFFVLTLIMAAFYGAVSYFFNFMFQELISQAAFTSVLVYFPKTILLMSNLHWIMLFLMVTGSIVLFGKKDQGQFI